MIRLRLAFVTILIATFAMNVSAHRLDEYLQATRIGIEVDHINLEVDLTPGAAVADTVFATIDLDGTGRVSGRETAQYANAVLHSLFLDIDGRTLGLNLVDFRFPTLDEMRRGEGILHLRATAAVGETAIGRHQLHFTNAHRRDIGVYLVNALVPGDERIHITGQSRDMLQREFSLDYSVSADESTAPLTSALPFLIGLTMAATLFTLTRKAKN
jgi:hypothetical protein